MWLPSWYKYVRGVSNDPIPLSLPLLLSLSRSLISRLALSGANQQRDGIQASRIGDCVVLARDLDGCGQRSVVVVVDEVGPKDIKTNIFYLSALSLVPVVLFCLSNGGNFVLEVGNVNGNADVNGNDLGNDDQGVHRISMYQVLSSWLPLIQCFHFICY